MHPELVDPHARAPYRVQMEKSRNDETLPMLGDFGRAVLGLVLGVGLISLNAIDIAEPGRTSISDVALLVLGLLMVCKGAWDFREWRRREPGPRPLRFW
jgi:hypothetical protein